MQDITNVQHKPDGLITYTNEITWMAALTPTGWGNGYVGLPEGHALYGKDYMDMDSIYIHGGLTFGEEVEIGGVKYWVFGFDTAHYMDSPATHNEEYVKNETESLYQQLISI